MSLQKKCSHIPDILISIKHIVSPYWSTEETQEHVLNECTGINSNQESKVQLQEIFDENTEQLKGKAEKIYHIMARLTKSGVVPKEVMQPGDLAT